MRIIQNTTEFEIEGTTATAIGKFDGIHKGHQRLLTEILSQKEQGRKAAVFTFDMHPSLLFDHDGHQGLLTTREEKEIIFRRMGVDILVEYPLNASTASMEPAYFVEEVLVRRMHVGLIAAGADLSFGHRGEGDAQLLNAMASQLGFEVSILEKVCYQGREISSTYVRESVEQGNMELVRELTGDFYSVTGIVEHGNKLGRTMGMPTVNLIPGERKLLPPAGVYFSTVLYAGKEYRGITNIGRKPTVSCVEATGVETYIYDFNSDIYGQEITVKLEAYRRPERKFAGIEQLKEQMKADLDAGRKYHTKKHV